MHIVLDDHLHADSHMDDDRADEQQHDDSDERRAQNLRHRRLVTAEQHDQNDHHGDGQRNIGDRGEALMPEMAGAGFGRAGAAHARERSADMLRPAHYGPPMIKSPIIHNTSVMAIEPIRLASASHSRSLGPKPRPVSQIKWRTPPSM